ncbi:MAG: methylmalonyl Co-A mutase-associated GTPase MeaB [Bacteroidales bacterium]|nr:methylmalonyl Co-A mutase-associated GTPase MeaB [Bacteroidales bacterium]MBN2819235.1 methylmalonyl Co-A mutase-associated GTPase MeaB [Bacteroidales bacterium]
MSQHKQYKSALSVSDGVEQPSVINENAVNNFKKVRRRNYSAEELTKGILEGDRMLLSKAITLIESNLPSHIDLAHQVINNCLPHSGKSIRIGITGVPGVGKSTFIESVGKHLTNNGHQIAVLAIDPSSERSKGSILGDKTRMELLSSDKNAFIRPSPSAGTLGGVARKTRETIFLCEAAGFDVIIIETVGVGQSEIAVHSMVDFFLLLMLSGAGDELQGIKRGIMEMADLIAITKCDGSNIKKAQQAKAEYSGALHLFPPTESGWIPDVVTCSSLDNTGIPSIWNKIEEYRIFTKANSYFEKRRMSQTQYWMFETIEEQLKQNFYTNRIIDANLEKVRQSVLSKELSSYSAAKILLDKYYNDLRK